MSYRFAVGGLAVFVSVAAAQAQSSVTRITTNPAGAFYSVDGQNTSQPMSALWPAGSKHTLSVSDTVQTNLILGEQLIFKDWEWGQGTFLNPTITVTSDPAITSYTAVFAVSYELRVSFFSCDGSGAPGPGTVYVNGVATNCDEQLFLPAGSAVTVQAIPNDGYIFTGWYSSIGQSIVGFQNTFSLNSPTTVAPRFAPTSNINLATSPPGLSVLADYSTIATPHTMQWGGGTIHTVGAISPQLDAVGKPWVFSSWSDGGAATHAYTVPQSGGSSQLTAVYGPGVGVSFSTFPSLLNISVDGTTGPPPYNFIWGIGETHTFSAPAQQTDTTGHVWNFSGWSNGGATAQSITVAASAVGVGVRLVATYVPAGHLTISSTLAGVTVTVNGSPCATPCEVKQPVGTQIDVAAPASSPNGNNSRQDLTGWTGGASGGPSDLVLTLGAEPISVYANYHTMNLLVLGSNPANSAMWSVQPASADGYYDSHTTVNITAKPQPGYKFVAWNGDLTGGTPTGSVVMNAPRTVLALMTKVPYVAAAGVENGAGTTPVTGVAPGSVISIFGANLAATTAIGSTNPLPQALGGVTIKLGDHMLPLFFVSPTQINLQLPIDWPPGDATLTVIGTGAPNIQTSFTVVANAPGLFSQVVNGQFFALAFHADGSLVTLAAPAQLGEPLTIYGTGFGATNPVRLEGFSTPTSPVYNLVDPVSISTGGTTVSASSAFALAGSVGVDVAQFTLTDSSLSGTNASVTVSINGQQSNTVLLPVK